MTKRTHLFPSLLTPREINFLKVAGASFLLLCAAPQFAMADTYEKASVATTQQATDKITGTVVDETGEPLIGVSVVVQGTAKGTITDINGTFSINVQKGETIKVSYMGYTTLTFKAGTQPPKIVLKEDTQKLDEVVVVGFGTQKKVNLTGSVSVVTGDDISKRPVANAAILLQGQIPGLRVNQGLGQPGGESTSFRIRGQGTFSSAGSDPLILINGVPGSMENLDPSVIESVSVLKDAASAAIYGARAANGVILVTTKQGANAGTTHISYHGNVGLYTPTKLYDRVTNSVEYMELANLAWKNSNMGKAYTPEQIDLYRNSNGNPQYPNFDWQDYMFNTAVVQTHNLAISGNGDKSSYNISLNFVDQPGTLKGFSYKKYNATIDLTTKINSSIKMGTYANLMYGQVEELIFGQNNVFLATLAQAPTYMPWLPDDGSGIRKWTSTAYPIEDYNTNTPALVGNNSVNKDNFDINAQMWLEINLLKNLTWHTKGAVRLQSNKTKDWRGSAVPIYNYHTGEETGKLNKGELGLTVTDSRRFYTNLYSYLKYDLSLAQKAHNFSLMAGYNQETEKYETLGAYRKEFAFDLPVIDAGSNADWRNNGNQEEWAIQSFFGRFNYNFKERYLFEANMRYDGTSRISKENRWGVFPSFSAAWRVTEEPFMQKLSLDWLNSLKLRGSWGQLGNQNIGLYPYQAMISGVSDYPFNKTSSGVVIGYQQTAYANRNIKWETTTVTDLGFDLQVLSGLNVTFDWYNKVTKDILRGSQVSGLLGLSAPIINDGTVQNKGVEIAINYANSIKKGALKGFHYNAGIYFDRSRNELIKFGAEEIGGTSIKREGLPYDEYYMLECVGVFADAAEVANSPKQFNDNTLPGDLKFRDISGPNGTPDGIIDNHDRTTFSGRFPGFEYGINAGASWNGFDLSLIGQGVADKKYYTSEWGIQPFIQGSAPNRDYVDNMWTEENPYGAKHPRIYWGAMGGGKNTRSNTYFLKDASFFRLKNLTFGYTLPRTITEKAKLSKVRIYFSGDNLFTITSYKGLDPERNGDGRDCIYPQNKIYSFGLNVEF